MKKIVISSIREGAGKTSIIAGLISSVNKKYGYIKPLGDRLIYRRKKSWDYDSNLIINLLNIETDMETHYANITLGFDHSKLKYMYDEEGIKTSLLEMVRDIGHGKDVLFVEGGRDISYGTSIYLDSLSVARYIDGSLIIIVSGDSDTIIDDIEFISRYLHLNDIKFKGVIANKVNDIDTFASTKIPKIKKMGIDVLGIIPYIKELTYFTVEFLAERLFVKIIAGEENLNAIVKNILVGEVLPTNHHVSSKFHRENQLIITSGERSDIILAALDYAPIGIVLTNNILPHQSIISKVTEKNIPIMLVSMETYEVVKRVNEIEALLTKDSQDKIRLLAQLVNQSVQIEDVFG